MARKGRVDPARDLMDFMGKHAQDSSKQVLPQLDTGTVIQINDPVDGTVVQLDNMQVAASDCNLLSDHSPVVGDRVMVLVHMEEFWIVGGIKADSTPPVRVPAGPAGGDLAGTYPNPTVKASVGLTGAPTGATASPGTSTTQLATTAFVQAALAAAVSASVPTGTITMIASAVADAGYLLCDGSAVSRTGANTALFAKWGTLFGAGDGSTTFNVADFRGRVPMGAGTGDASDATAHALASKTGTETHILSVAQMPAHDHSPTSNGLTGSTTPGVTGGPSTNTSDSTTPGNSGTSTDTGTTDASGVVLPNAGTAGTVVNPGSLMIGSQWGTAISAGVTAYNGSQTSHSHTFTTAGHVHTAAAHTHTMGNHTHTSAAHTHSLSSQGSSSSHPNIQPSLTINFQVKL